VQTLVKVVVGVLLVAHGLVHLMFFVTNDDRSWPFRLDRSWLVPQAARRPVALVLIAATVLAVVLLGLAVWGVPGLATAWPVLALVAAAASLAVLVVFWDTRLLWGVAIDVVLVVLAVWRPEWTEQIG
jgi:hypothetical protein